MRDRFCLAACIGVVVATAGCVAAHRRFDDRLALLRSHLQTSISTAEFDASGNPTEIQVSSFVYGPAFNQLGWVEVAGDIPARRPRIGEAFFRKVSQMEALRALNVDGCQYDSKDVARLRSRSICDLSMCGPSADNDVLIQLGRLPRLKVLCLRCSRITDDGLSALEGCEDLSEIDLCGTQITDMALLRLARVRTLRRIVIDRDSVSEEGKRAYAAAGGAAEITSPEIVGGAF